MFVMETYGFSEVRSEFLNIILTSFESMRLNEPIGHYAVEKAY
jgi:hypothetical protein